MIAAMDVEGVMPYLAGPGAAVLVLLLVLGCLYQVVVKHLIPLLSRAVDRHLAQIDRLIETQRDESRGILQALTAIDKRLQLIESKGSANAG